MRLDLGDHDLDALLGPQVVFVLAHELQVQPYVIEHKADDHGDGQEGHRLVLHAHGLVQQHGTGDRQHGEQRYPRLLALGRVEFPNRDVEQVRQQRGADDEARFAQRPAVKVVVRVDPEACAGKQRRQVYRRVRADRQPRPSEFLFRLHHLAEQHQYDRADGISENGGQRSGDDPRFRNGQPVFREVLDDQAEHQQCDGPQDVPVAAADVRVDADGEHERRQQHQYGRHRQDLDVGPGGRHGGCLCAGRVRQRPQERDEQRPRAHPGPRRPWVQFHRIAFHGHLDASASLCAGVLCDADIIHVSGKNVYNKRISICPRMTEEIKTASSVTPMPAACLPCQIDVHARAEQESPDAKPYKTAPPPA